MPLPPLMDFDAEARLWRQQVRLAWCWLLVVVGGLALIAGLGLWWLAFGGAWG